MIVEVFVLSTVMAASSQRCSAGERTFSLESGRGMCVVAARASKDPLYSATLEEAIAKDFGLIPEVRYVRVDRAEKSLLVWIALDNPNEENREKILYKQFDLIDAFPEVSFDFNIVSTQGLRPEDFATDGKMLYLRS